MPTRTSTTIPGSSSTKTLWPTAVCAFALLLTWGLAMDQDFKEQHQPQAAPQESLPECRKARHHDQSKGPPTFGSKCHAPPRQAAPRPFPFNHLALERNPHAKRPTTQDHPNR